jgi:Zn-dependent protease with chaperone function
MLVSNRPLRLPGVPDPRSPERPTPAPLRASYSAASVLIRHQRDGTRRLANTVPVGRIGLSLRSRDLDAHVLVRVPNYATPSSVSLPRRLRPRHMWYDATHAPPALTMTVRASVPAGLLVLLLYLRIFLPTVGIAGFGVGLAVGISRRLPERVRVGGFDWLGQMLPVAAGFAGLASGFAFENSVYQRLIADVWFGDPRSDFVLPWMFAWFGALGFVLPLTAFGLRSRILRGLDEEADVADFDHLLRRATRHGLMVAASLAAFGVYVLATRAFGFTPSRLVTHVHSVIPCLVGPVAILITQSILWRPNALSHELTARAKELAPLLGVSVRAVKVAGSSYAKRNANGCAIRKRTIVVTQKAADSLMPRHMDWLLGHELAHYRDVPACRTPFWLLSFALLGSTAAALAGFWLDGYARQLPAIWLMGLLPIAMLAAALDIGEIRRRLEYEADAQGLLAVGDVGIAVSAARAMAEQCQSPKQHDQELDGVHPRLVKRIKAMRAAAERMGIPDRGAEVFDA